MTEHLQRHGGTLLCLAACLVVLASACRPSPEFYQPPAELPAQPGEVIRTVKVIFDKKFDINGTAVMYRSTSATGEPIAVTGTVYMPWEPWAGPGDRPVVGFAPGTQGMADRCAPSHTLPLGGSYEQGIIASLLAQGWAVAITDYEGMGPPGDPTYLVKDAEAHAVLDMVRAAQQVPESGVTAASPVGLWGYSQGGQAVSAAAEIEATYAPELDIRGVLAGGVPSDPAAVVANLDGDGPGNQFFAFLAFAAVGLDAAYPELDLETYLNADGTALLDAARNGRGFCLSDGLDLLAGHHIADLTTSNPLDTPAWQARVDQQRLGTGQPTVPVFLYHGLADQVVPFEQGTGLRDAWCAQGTEIQFREFPVDHISGVFVATGDGIAFMTSRFAGQPMVDECPAPSTPTGP